MGVTEDGGIVLVEAKAHLAELVSPPTQASPVSRAKIEKALAQAKSALGVDDVFDWTAQYYQLANRIAHLWFLRDLGENAHLLLVDFMGDEEMAGPMDRSGWYQAYDNAHCTLGLPDNHLLTPYIHHVFPAVGALNVPVEDRRAIK